MKDRKAMGLARWLDEVSETALASEVRVVPSGPARELPPGALTQGEANAFRDGYVIGLQLCTTTLECMVDGSAPDVPGASPAETYAQSISWWMDLRRAREEKLGGGEAA